MSSEFCSRSERAERLKQAMRRAHCLGAVIRATEYGVLIELSDGRTCSASFEGHQSRRRVVSAAMQWARRHGAVSVEILD